MNKLLETSVYDTELYGFTFASMRRARGLSNKKFTKRIGISPSFYSLIESGKRTIGDELFEKILKANGITLEDFILLTQKLKPLKKQQEKLENLKCDTVLLFLNNKK